MEKVLNLFVGSFLLSNLYYLSSIVGLSNLDVIIFLFIISFLGFVLRFNLSNLKLLGTKLVIRLVSLSFFLFIINSLFNYEFYSKDIIRIAMYVFYFCWTFSIFKNNKILLENHFKKLIIILFVLIVLMSFFEYFFYDFFKLIINANFVSYGNSRRLAITFIDPNSFAFALISFSYVYSRIENSSYKKIIILFITILLVNFTGSRLGLLLFLILVIPYLVNFFRSFNYSNILLIILVSPILFLIPKSINDNSKSASIIERIFESEKSSSASVSTNERIESLKSGLKASDFSNILIPPGNFNFRSKWDKVIEARHYPHSTFVYMFVEYGIYFIWPLLIFLQLYKKAKRTKTLSLYFILISSFLLLPNLIYYSTIFFIIFYIEHEYSNHTTIPSK